MKISELLEVAKPPLNKYELVLVQTTKDGIEGMVLITTLLHNSGQWIASDYPLKPSKDDPQCYGSAITYARCYSIATSLGLVAAT